VSKTEATSLIRQIESNSVRGKQVKANGVSGYKSGNTIQEKKKINKEAGSPGSIMRLLPSIVAPQSVNTAQNINQQRAESRERKVESKESKEQTGERKVKRETDQAACKEQTGERKVKRETDRAACKEQTGERKVKRETNQAACKEQTGERKVKRETDQAACKEQTGERKVKRETDLTAGRRNSKVDSICVMPYVRPTVKGK
jgi:hypothetical protein